MHRRAVWGAVTFLAGCGASVNGGSSEVAVDAAAEMVDAAPDAAEGIDAPPLGSWSTPAKVGPAATTAAEDDVTLSSDALELIFAIQGSAGKDLFYTSRASTTAPWADITRLAFSSPDTSEETPRFSPDDLTLYFASDSATTQTLDIYTVTRPARGSLQWTAPERIDAVSTDDLVEKWFMPCGPSHYVMAQSGRGVGTDLVEGTVGSAPSLITELSSTENDTAPFVTQDCLTIFFASARSGTITLYTSGRAAIGDPWQPPAQVRDFAVDGSTDNQEDPWMSPDGRIFAFSSNRDIYISTR